MARRRALPDLSALLHGHERRRHRRSARRHRPASTTCNGSASTASGSIRSRPRPTRTGATTSPTTAASIPRSARSPTPRSSSPRRRRGIRVMLDLVPNHSSDQHPWFRDAISSRDSKHRDWYVWADPKPDGSPPNNWVMAFDPRARVDVRRGERSVLPQPVPVDAARSQLVERRRATRSTTSCASGSTGVSPASASTCATRSSRTVTCATTRPPPRTTTGGCR